MDILVILTAMAGYFNKIIRVLQYYKELRHFKPINPGVVLWRGGRVAQILVKMDETLWRCGCCGPDGSSRCSHVQALEYLIEHGMIQLDQADYPPKSIHYLVDKPVPAAHCYTAALV